MPWMSGSQSCRATSDAEGWLSVRRQLPLTGIGMRAIQAAERRPVNAQAIPHARAADCQDRAAPRRSPFGIASGCKHGFNTGWLAFEWQKPVFCIQIVYSASGSLTINKPVFALVLYAP